MTSLRSISSFALVLALSCQLTAQEGVRWHNDIETAKQIAARSNRLVLIHYWIRGCPPCVNLERNVFNQDAFARSVEADFVPVKINAQDFPITARRYGVNSFPADVIITPTGQVVLKSRCVQDAKQYASHLRQIAQSHHRSVEQIASNNRPDDNPNRPAFDRRDRKPPEDSNAPRRQETDPQLAARADAGRGPIGTDRRRSENLDVRRPLDSADRDRYDERRPIDRQQRVVHNDRQPRYDDPRDRYEGAGSSGSQHDPRLDGRRESSPSPAPRGPAYESEQESLVARNPASVRSDSGNDYDRPRGGEPREKADRAQPSADRVAAARPEFGLDGFCPIQLTESFRWVAGDVRWGVNHEGRTYLFTSLADRDRFLDKPDRYSPVLAGYDVVQWSKHQTLANGRREFGVIYRNRVYLFVSEQSLETFQQQPGLFVSRVEQAKRAATNRR